MAIAPTFVIPMKAQEKILLHAKSVISQQKKFTELHSKMTIIDQAYARYKEAEASGSSDGVDTNGNTSCGDIFSKDEITAPIVVAQVDSLVAYLADIFIGGYPMFPVVSSPTKKENAEKLETLLDDHAQLGGYARQLLLMLKDGVKYNLSAIETDWTSVEQFSVLSDYSSETMNKTEKVLKYFTKIKRLDLYNTVWDYSVPPGDVAADGDYAGYIEIISKTKLKRLLNKLSAEKKALNITEALASFNRASPNNNSGTGTNYTKHPSVSKYVSPNSQHAGVNWDIYLGASDTTGGIAKSINMNDGSYYEKFVLYARILPSDFDIKAPSANTPQIWKLTIINMSVVVEATRVISAFDYLPILFGQPLEDGLGYQTQSLAEGSIPFQEAATTLYNIRFAAARRAVSDRALYNPDFINPSDINSKAAAPKIPVRLKALSNLGLDSAYKQIPFDMRGTETTIQDARAIVGFSQELSGINGPQQGQFQKGNKSVQEWNDTIGGSDNRLRLPAMLYEHQVFGPLKQILALNIFQYGENAQIMSQKTGEVLDIDISKLRNEVLSFRMADGYSPKAKLASTEMLTAGMTMLMNSPILQQSYGAMLPQMFAHMMQLGGVRDLAQYAPNTPEAPTAPNLLGASLQQGVPSDPSTGLPSPATAPALPMP